ncbi:alanine aminotransferase 2-like [Oncorhynchus keta]|uniref:alanine aminotransferase 2-like n=1 Tax=Oncorhynchus keta TaxID=8018 RepID=UPI0015FA20C3|nr:alanine aminotransferase 2-like [Oncorhynchus keta]XP_052317732.1 alanine aminotransferase 2-like [Oncorhynchus keta]
MYSLREVNPMLRGIRVSPHWALQRHSEQITTLLQQGEQKPFKEVIDISSGDSHRTGIKPISFVRQVLSVCLYPELLHNDTLPVDVRQRAQRLLGECDGGSVGSYTDSCGLPHVQRSVAEFITGRDGGVPSYPHNIFISAGSQIALKVMLKLLVRGKGVSQTGVLTPQPCPHTLPMLLEEVGAVLVPYQLSEEQGWALEPGELHRALTASRGHCRPRALYISNPGIPTGHVQSRKSIEWVIQFAAEERLFLLVNEVYQDCVYGEGMEFMSYKRVLFEMGQQYSEMVELASFHSISNGIIGECGLCAGYMELVNVDPAVMVFAETLLCTDICAPVTGQIALEIMVNPPRPGDPSHSKYTQEILTNRITLAQNAQRAWEFLIGLPGVSCQPVTGGIFIYPRLSLPPEAVEQARSDALEADVLYSQSLLDEEGVCVGAGCEHGQREDKYHIRLCVLTPSATLEKVLACLGSFHLHFLDQFSQHA